MKTRTKGAAKIAAEATESAKSTTPKVQLSPESANPPQLFILPEDLSPEARVISLTNPRYLTQCRYIFCPDRGLYELTRVAAPKTAPRSWLLSKVVSQVNHLDEDVSYTRDVHSPTGFVTRAADLYIATQLDPLFFLLPALAPPLDSKNPALTKKLFLSSEDYLERVISTSPQLDCFIRTESFHILLEKRMAVVCDTVDAGDEIMYRLNEEKLLQHLLKKAKQVAAGGLSPSIEENFVRKALEIPVLSIKWDECFQREHSQEDEAFPTESVLHPVADIPDTQTTRSSTESAANSFSEVSTAATSFSEDYLNTVTLLKPRVTMPPINAPDGVADLLRHRVALSFICSNYLAPHLSELLKNSLLSPSSPIDFGPLDIHLAHLKKLRQEALAARSLGDYSRKRSMNEDDESLETRAEKKRKKDEEEKRKKAGESRGVKNLKKVNVSGMKKMSDFFKKK